MNFVIFLKDAGFDLLNFAMEAKASSLYVTLYMGYNDSSKAMDCSTVLQVTPFPAL